MTFLVLDRGMYVRSVVRRDVASCVKVLFNPVPPTLHHVGSDAWERPRLDKTVIELTDFSILHS